MDKRHAKFISEIRKAIYELGFYEAWEVAQNHFKKELHQQDNNIAQQADIFRKIEKALEGKNNNNQLTEEEFYKKAMSEIKELSDDDE
jgi:uncharacterized protein YjaZ